jgi:hypothetical protein
LITWAAPCAFASSAFSLDPTVPIRFTPIARAHWQAIRPTPPAAAWNRMVWPGCTCIGAVEQVLHRQALQHHGGRGLEIDRVRQAHQDVGRHHAQLAVGAVRPAGIGHAVARLHVGHALADRLDHAGAFLAQAGGQRHRVQAGAEIDVDKFRPIACWRTRASPGPGSPTSTSTYSSTSGPPVRAMRIALAIILFLLVSVHS